MFNKTLALFSLLHLLNAGLISLEHSVRVFALLQTLDLELFLLKVVVETMCPSAERANMEPEGLCSKKTKHSRSITWAGRVVS